MCGILCVLQVDNVSETLRRKVCRLQKILKHRGPDWSGIHTFSHAILAHERLGIVDPTSGDQPILGVGGTVAVSANGEIYNHQSLRRSYAYDYKTGSDCEPLIPLYLKNKADPGEWVSYLDGQYAFTLYDSQANYFIIARDPIGICPLYYGYGENGELWVSSELKAIRNECQTFQQFPPGHYLDPHAKAPVPFFSAGWYTHPQVPKLGLNLARIRDTLTAAVGKRLMTDVPWGVLLSGGLDSSLVASIATRLLKDKTRVYDKMHTFSVGLKGSPDLRAAQDVAKFIGSIHHEFTFTVQNGLDVLRDVIYYLETYDVTTVRAATPMFLMARKIKACGIKMVLSGEGADEVMAGYLYFHKAPSPEELFHETVRKLKDLMYFDCLRANKSMMAWGVEARVPFLDRDWLDLAMELDPVHKMSGTHPERPKMEKWVLREAFSDPKNPYLPDSVLWRQKEQFSDGVGYNWIGSLKAHADKEVTDRQLANARHKFPYNTPKTKEAYYIRNIFEEFYPESPAVRSVPSPGGKSSSGTASVACSTAAAIAWDQSFMDMAKQTNGECSGRAVIGVHNCSIETHTTPRV